MEEAGGTADDASAAFRRFANAAAGFKIGKPDMEFMRAWGQIAKQGEQLDWDKPEKAFHQISEDLARMAKTDPGKALRLGEQM